MERKKERQCLKCSIISIQTVVIQILFYFAEVRSSLPVTYLFPDCKYGEHVSFTLGLVNPFTSCF